MSNVSFAIGTGRCGTQFLAKVMEKEKEFTSVHERNPLNDTFHRYCKWYKIPLDSEGFLNQKQREVEGDLQKRKFSFEASAFLSLSVVELCERFNAKFVFLVRSPEKVITSYLHKGWYEQKLAFKDPNKPLSYQPTKEFHQFLGRPAPMGDELVEWNEMSRVCKLAWYWTVLNEEVLKQLAVIPKENYLIQRLEDLNFGTYSKIISFLGGTTNLNEKAYNKISTPNSYTKKPTMEVWSQQDKDYFVKVSAATAKKFNYDSEKIVNK
jgi:hypothetical protein